MYRMEETNRPDLVAFDRWLNSIGRSPVTGWRWRKKGWVETVNISGRTYVQRSAIDKFLARVQRGEFAKVATVPGREVAQ
jgi:hypothetical protein